MITEGDIEARRESQRGRSVKDVIGASRDMLVLRAVVGEDPVIGQMDYVFASNSRLMPGAAERVLDSMEEGTPLRRNEDKLLKKAIEHACTVALYHGEVSSVVAARVKSDDLYEATNPGEYFYDGQQKISGTVVAQANEFGFASKPKETRGLDVR